MEPELTEPFRVHRRNSESKRNQDIQILLESMEQTLKKNGTKVYRSFWQSTEQTLIKWNRNSQNFPGSTEQTQFNHNSQNLPESTEPTQN